jgi:hypothetical protein
VAGRDIPGRCRRIVREIGVTDKGKLSRPAMVDLAGMKLVAEQLLSGPEVRIEGGIFLVTRTGKGRFRTVRFMLGGKEFQAIEQNAEKPSRWGQLARNGHRVVQFRDLQSQKYVAVSVDGEVREYGRSS